MSYAPTIHSAPTGEYSAALADLASRAQVADVTLTAAQVLALNATPRTLIAAPGANKAIIVTGVQFYLPYNSAAYAVDAADDINIRYTDGSGQLVATVETTGFLTATSNQSRYAYPATTAAITPAANAPIVIQIGNSEVITGDSPLKVRVFYYEIDLVL